MKDYERNVGKEQVGKDKHKPLVLYSVKRKQRLVSSLKWIKSSFNILKGERHCGIKKTEKACMHWNIHWRLICEQVLFG